MKVDYKCYGEEYLKISREERKLCMTALLHKVLRRQYLSKNVKDVSVAERTDVQADVTWHIQGASRPTWLEQSLQKRSERLMAGVAEAGCRILKVNVRHLAFVTDETGRQWRVLSSGS